MYYVYVLFEQRNRRFYVGYTHHLRRRLQEHEQGQVASTAGRTPLELAYYEAAVNREDALHREKYLKTTYGKRYIRSRLRRYLEAKGK